MVVILYGQPKKTLASAAGAAAAVAAVCGCAVPVTGWPTVAGCAADAGCAAIAGCATGAGAAFGGWRGGTVCGCLGDNMGK